MLEPATQSADEGHPTHPRGLYSSPSLPQVTPGRPEAAGAVWDWRHDHLREVERSLQRQARIRATVQSLIGGVLGVLLFLFASRAVAALVWSLAGLTLAAALISPNQLYPKITGIISLLGTAIGRTMTWLLLAPLFYLFFLPFGILGRRGPNDRLERRFEPRVPSYWKKRDPSRRSASEYERQF